MSAGPTSAPPPVRLLRPDRRYVCGALASGWAAAGVAWASNAGVRLDVRFGAWDVFRPWAAELRARVQVWWPLMTAALSSPGVVAPDVVHVEFIEVTPETVARLTGTPLYQRLGVRAEGVAAITRGTTIHVNGPFLLARLRDPDMFGMMAHELTHVVQAYPHTSETWLVEGVADYVRYYVLLPQDPGRRFDPGRTRYDEGYQATAGLLDWIEQRRPGAVREVNAVLRRGGDGRAAVSRVAGAEPEALWSAYLASRPAAAGLDEGPAGFS